MSPYSFSGSKKFLVFLVCLSGMNETARYLVISAYFNSIVYHEMKASSSMHHKGFAGFANQLRSYFSGPVPHLEVKIAEVLSDHCLETLQQFQTKGAVDVQREM